MIDKLQDNIKCILLTIICLILFVPHYDLDGNLVLCGNFYSKINSEAFKQQKTTHSNTQNDLLKTIDTLKKSLHSISNKLNTKEQDIRSLEEDKKKLEIDVQTLQFKIKQQHDFYEIKEKKDEEKKKTEFAQVSKKTINIKRPEIGNMFSKSLKKTTKK
tara:strand:- start:114 stop:590 length:477 start_codon:yes stop_codon:yes gene_type:complete